MVQLESKESRKRPADAENSSASSHQKKRRVLPDASSSMPATAAEGQNNNKVNKKPTKGLQKRSAETLSPAPEKKRRVLPDAPHTSAEGHNNGNTAEVFSVDVMGVQKSTNTKTLAAYFGKFGEVTRVHLVASSDEASDGSESCRTVTFSSKRAVDAVLAQTHQIEGQNVSVHASEHKKQGTSKAQVQNSKLFVGNVPKEVSEWDLEKHFSQFGAIKRLILPRNKSSLEHKGFAYVTFTDSLDHEKALAVKKHKFSANGKKVCVQVVSQKKNEPKKERNKAIKVYISGIPEEVGKKDLEKHFSQFGDIKHISLPTKPEDRSAHRGFAFIDFARKIDQEKALEDCQHKVKGHVISVMLPNSLESPDKMEIDKTLEVFVSKIPKDVGEKDLRKLFSQFGSVKAITLPTKAEDRSVHRGFAFVKFGDDLAKEKAVKAGQLEVKGQIICMRASDSSESASKSDVNKPTEVFVHKIPKDATKEDLQEHFSQFGSITSITLPTKPEDRSAHRGFAFVQFADDLSKKGALVASEQEMNGQIVLVRDSKTKEQPLEKEPKKALEVFVSKIPKDATKEDLEEHFSQFGSVKSITLPTKPEDRSAHRGFAFVRFADELAKEEALAADKHKVNGEVLHLKDASEPKEFPAKKEKCPALEVFVQRLPKGATKEDLEEHFSQFGSIASVTLPTKPEDRSAHRGFAFVQFADEPGKEEALACDEHKVNGQVVQVRSAKSPDSPDVKQHKTVQLAAGGQWVKNSIVACGLPSSTTAETLSLHFSQYGKVDCVKMIRKPGKRNSAVVVFVHKKGVKAALKVEHQIDYASIDVTEGNLNTQEISDKSLDAELEQSGDEGMEGESEDDEDLEDSDEDEDGQEEDDEDEDGQEGDDDDEDGQEGEDEDENDKDEDSEEN